MDNCGPEEKNGRGISPERQDFEMDGERRIQDDTWENWADNGVISEFKRTTENNPAVVYNLQTFKMKRVKECSQTVLEEKDMRVPKSCGPYVLSTCCPITRT